MLIPFFMALRAAGMKASVGELLSLLAALRASAELLSAQEFYFLARTALVKDERHYDLYDRVFASYFSHVDTKFPDFLLKVPPEWLADAATRSLSADERAAVQSLGGWQRLLDTLRDRLREQSGAHQGGNKWIGTAGTSPFGAHGYNPEGVRLGVGTPGAGRAVKVWERREFRDLDDTRQLDTRNYKMALRRLRRYAREGAAEVLDLPDTIASTARNAGLLEVKWVAERRNATRVLLLLDVGGSMDAHVQLCERLFSAARSEFRHFAQFYFHNFIYETLWRSNRRRHSQRISTLEVLRAYRRDYRVIIVGDAAMSPYEILQPGGSVEHWNEESGARWIARLTEAFPHLAWLNPLPQERWQDTESVGLTRRLVAGRMFELTPAGIAAATQSLRQPAAQPAGPAAFKDSISASTAFE